MIASTFRKLTLVLAACLMAVFFTACGDNNPSLEGASKLALEIHTALYKGDIKPFVDHLDLSKLKNDEERAAARQMMEGKLKALVEKRMPQQVEKNGGLDSITIGQTSEKEGQYQVEVIVKFKNAKTDDTTYKMRWNAETKAYVLDVK